MISAWASPFKWQLHTNVGISPNDIQLAKMIMLGDKKNLRSIGDNGKKFVSSCSLIGFFLHGVLARCEQLMTHADDENVF